MMLIDGLKNLKKKLYAQPIFRWFSKKRDFLKKKSVVLEDLQDSEDCQEYYPRLYQRMPFFTGVSIATLIWLIIFAGNAFLGREDFFSKATERMELFTLLSCQVTIIGLFVPLVISAVTSLLQKRGEGVFINYFYKKIQFGHYLISSTLLAVMLLGQALFGVALTVFFTFWFALNVAYSSWIIFLSVTLFIPAKLERFVRECIANELIDEVAYNAETGR